MADLQTISRWALPVAATGFVFVVVVLPLLRMKRKTGIWAITAGRASSSVERALGILLLVGAFALVAWSAFYAAVGPMGPGWWDAPDAILAAGWAVVVLGTAIIALAQYQMGAAWRIGIEENERTELVTSGLFAVIRNPIYTGMFVALIGFLLICPSGVTLGGVILVWIALVLQTRREEQHMLKLHGEAYAGWAARTGRFVPMLGRLRAS